MSLTVRIVVAMALAFVFGSLAQYIVTSFPETGIAGFINEVLVEGIFFVLGKIFIASLKVMIVPLVFVSLICGVSSLGENSRLGLMSVKTLGLYLATTAIAITLAITAAEIVQPGVGFDATTGADYEAKPPVPLTQVFINLFPSNPIQAMAEGNMLQLIIFSILLGIAISKSGETGQRIASHFNDWNEVLLKLVTMLLQLAPFGVFALLFTTFAKTDPGKIFNMVWYFMTVFGVLIIHGATVYPTLLKLFSGLNPILFLKKMRNNQLFAFSTSSSSATLPVTLRTVEERLGVNNSVASFTVPLGATINMDGTAIMQGVATVFIAQAYGVDIGLAGYLMVILTATLASIGTAGVPGVGLVMLVMVLEQVNLPAEAIGIIIGVDRLLDMARTAVNVTGDAAVSCIVAKSEGRLDEKTFNNPKAGEVQFD